MKASKEAKEYSLDGRDLKCIMCSHDKFWTRKTLMNTKLLTLWKLDWSDREADNYICERCGYVHWFLKR